MKDESIQIVKLYELFGSTISTREAARFVLKKINEAYSKEKVKSITVNFAKIEFISRSFADEFLKVKEKLEKQKKIAIRFIYMKKIVIDILKSVSRTQKGKPKRILKISSFTVEKNIEELGEILPAI